jgi:hypothetical protein
MPNGVGAMSVRPVVTSPKRRPPPKATRHSSAGGINGESRRLAKSNGCRLEGWAAEEQARNAFG